MPAIQQENKIHQRKGSSNLMQKMMLRLSLLALPLFTPQSADACSCAYYKVWGFLSTDGVVPSNSPGLLWMGEVGDTPAKTNPVQILDESGKATAIESKPYRMKGNVLSIRYALRLFRPKGGFQANKSYTFLTNQHLSGEGFRPQSIKVTVSDTEVKQPKAIVQLKKGVQVAGLLKLAAGVSCSGTVAANQLPIAMELPPELKPFKEQFYYETFLDGDKEWKPASSMCSPTLPGRSWQGKAVDLLYSTCDISVSPDVGPGKQKVTMRASLPGTDIQFTTAPIEVELPCPKQPIN